MTSDELIAIITQEVKGLASKLVANDYTNAVAKAQRETGFSLPATDETQIDWLMRRTHRHLIYYLMTESAGKIKFEQINSQHKFEHYYKMIEFEDAAFNEYKEKESVVSEGYAALGTYVEAGFSYDQFGRDTTYQEENKVIITPSSEDA